tara:strand:- start:1071 stop:4001 length:2931 start_codon:yes stop_codon:yes gene_type:complete
MFFRTPISGQVQRYLFEKIDALNRRGGNQTLNNVGLLEPQNFENQPLPTMLNRMCWAKVTSATPIENDDGDVIRFEPVRLSTSISKDNKTPINRPLSFNKNPYNIQKDYEWRGETGITSITTETKGYYIYTSTINFVCPDPDDFDQKVLPRFLKHGRMALLEYGWSNPESVDVDFGDISEPRQMNELMENLRERNEKGRGRYQAFVGVIDNYSYNQRNDGSYEGSFTMKSLGRNMLGQSIGETKLSDVIANVMRKSKDGESKPESKVLQKSLIQFAQVMNNLNKVVQYYVGDETPKSYGKGKVVREETSYYGGRTTGGHKEDEVLTKYKNGALELVEVKGLNIPKEYKTYVSWGWFEDHILNSFFSFTADIKNTDGSVSPFKTEIRSVSHDKDDKGEYKLYKNLCRDSKNLYSIGLKHMIMPHKFKPFDPIIKEKDKKFFRNDTKLQLKQQVLDNIFRSMKQFPQAGVDENGKDRLMIRNLVFPTEYLKQNFSTAQTIEEGLKSLWSQVSMDYGGFWEFDVICDDSNSGRLSIIDIHQGQLDNIPTGFKERKSTRNDFINFGSTTPMPYKNIFEFPLYNKNSFIKDFSIDVKMSPEMATMAVYGTNSDIEITTGDSNRGDMDLRTRAISILANTSPKKRFNKTLKDNETLIEDGVLSNLSYPVQGDDTIGTSSVLEAEREVSKLLKDTGIDFSKIPSIKDSTDEIIKKIAQKQNSDYSDKSVKEITEELKSKSYWFSSGNQDLLIYDTNTLSMFDNFLVVMKYKINKSMGENDSSNYTVTIPEIPISLSMTIDGTGGLKIGDLFLVDYLPHYFREYVAFMIKGISHNVSTSGWSTTIQSFMIVDIPNVLKDFGALIEDDEVIEIQSGYSSFAEYIDDTAKEEKFLSEKTSIGSTKSVGGTEKVESQTLTIDNPDGSSFEYTPEFETTSIESTEQQLYKNNRDLYKPKSDSTDNILKSEVDNNGSEQNWWAKLFGGI